MLRRIFIITLTLLLVGCGPLRKPSHYKLVPPSSAKGQRCLKNCHTMKMMCYKMCHSVDSGCADREQQRAKQEFANYQKHQLEQQIAVTKTWENFYNPMACKDKACGCKKDYNACFQMCGGQLVPVYN